MILDPQGGILVMHEITDRDFGSNRPVSNAKLFSLVNSASLLGSVSVVRR